MEGTVAPGENATPAERAADKSSPHDGSFSLAWIFATANIAGVEWLLLIVQSRLIAARQGALLLLFSLGHWLTYALGVVLVLRVAAEVRMLLERRVAPSRALWLVAGAFAVLASPYAIWLARFTFSGPRARVMAHHGLLVAVTATCVASIFGLAIRLSSVELGARWQRWTWASSLGLGVFGVAWLSRAIMPSEYEPLHGFLALLALTGAGLFGIALSREWPRVSFRHELFGGTALVACAFLTEFRLARAEEISWILWSQTACSRYVAQRWSFLAEAEQPVETSELTTKPDLETTLTLAWRKQRAGSRAPNIVIFSIDGLVPEHVGAYGYTARPTTPNIDHLARKGVRFLRAFSTYPATKQFNSSLLLGRLVPESGASHAPASFREKAITRLLHERGYHTLVQSWFESSTSHRFDPKYFQIDTNVEKTRGKDVLELPMAERMVAFERHAREAEESGKPIFMWMHLLSTHPVSHNFVPHPRFAWGDSRAQRYDSAIAGTDLWLPELEKIISAHADAARGTIWIICADHGVRVESAGRDLYANIVRVPLIVVGPGLEPRTVDAPVETAVDLAATVLDFAGVTPPDSYDGVSLVPLLIRGDVGSRMGNRVIPLMRGSWRGAVYGPFKLLRYKDSFSFFDSRTDPNEENNIFSGKESLARQVWKMADAEIKRRVAAFKKVKEVASNDDEDEVE